jgi:hypothetical protein
MKNHSWIFGLIAFTAIIMFSITACAKDDDDTGSPPSLDGCWHLTSSLYNETFTFDVANGTFDKMDDEGWGERGTFTFTATAFTTTITHKTDDGSTWTAFTKPNETRPYVLSGDTLLVSGEWEYKKVKDNSHLLDGSWHIGAPHNETFTFNMTAKTFEKMNDEHWGEKGTLTCTAASITTTVTHLTADGDNWTVWNDPGKSPVTTRQYVIDGNTLKLNKSNVYTKQ